MFPSFVQFETGNYVGKLISSKNEVTKDKEIYLMKGRKMKKKILIGYEMNS